jgi:peptide-methionine (S)-S-oxide reductase
VEFFFRMHDPTTENRQLDDIGTQYRSVIFTHTPQQEHIAKEVTERIQQRGKISGKIVTQIQTADGIKFYPAELYHQQYLDQNPNGYCNHKLYW